MEQFLGYILGTIIFFYLLGNIGKFLLKLFIARKMKQFSNGNNRGGSFFSGGFNTQRESAPNNDKHKEGEVFISVNSPSQKKIKDKVGEYVDFEEVK
ncbi:MAG: DUF4834 family protein [Rikenellaceae bacterium]